MEKPRPAWIKDKSTAEDFEIIDCKPFEPYKDWKQDNGCYILIRIYRDLAVIGVAICDYKHTILKEFRGRLAQDLYWNIFKYSEENNKNWFTRFEHCAYLGKELKKAEIALALGCEYYQE